VKLPVKIDLFVKLPEKVESFGISS